MLESINDMLDSPGLFLLVGAVLFLLGVGTKISFRGATAEPSAVRVTRIISTSLGVVLIATSIYLFVVPGGAERPGPASTAPPVAAEPPGTGPSSDAPTLKILIDQPKQGQRVDVGCTNANSCTLSASGRLSVGNAGYRAYLLIGFADASVIEYYVQYDSTTTIGELWVAEAYVDNPTVDDTFLLRAVLVRNPVGVGATGGLVWTEAVATGADVVAESETISVTIGGVAAA